MYLSDKNILEEIEKGNLSIIPFNKEHLTPNGYDLEVEIDDIPSCIDSYMIEPNKMFKIKTKEEVHLGSNIIAFMYLRSRYTRQGLIGLFAVVDAGFNGKLIATIKNLSDSNIELNLKEGVVHIVFAYLKDKATNPYGSTDKSHFQNQK